MQTATELSRTRTVIRDVTLEIAGMLREAPDEGKRLPRSEWTVGETAAHLAVAQKGMADIATGEIPNPYDGAGVDDFAPINAAWLDRFGERRPAVLAELLTAGTETFLTTIGALPEYRQVPTPLGTTDVATLYAYNLAHLMMHGYPLAKALGKPTPVNRERALLAVPFLQAVMPRVFDAGAAGDLSASLEIRMWRGPRFAIIFENRQCRVDRFVSRPVDCHIVADPAAFFLVSAGVVSQWGPIARGRMLAWGRKPWLAFKLKALLPNP